MPESHTSPPSNARRFLRMGLKISRADFLIDDFDQMYLTIAGERGFRAARRWYRLQVFQSLPGILFNSLYWRTGMILNFLKITLRYLRRHRGYALLNISGLAVGLGFVFLIGLFIHNETHFDRFHERADRIYRLKVLQGNAARQGRGTAVSPAVAGAMVAENPEVEAAVRIFHPLETPQLTNRESSIPENRFYFVDPNLFEVFSFPLLEGDPHTALDRPHSLVISRTAVRKYFPDGKALGRIVAIDFGRGAVDYEVRGVAEDAPERSHFRFDFLAPFSDHEISRVDNWFLMAVPTYLLLKPGASPDRLSARFPDMIHRHAGALFDEEYSFDDWLAEGNLLSLSLQPMTDIHLHSKGTGPNFEPVGDIQYVYLFTIVALLILAAACFNFVNLSIARLSDRAEEIGMRKVLGSSRSLLVRQFLTESIVLSTTALLFGLALARLLHPLLEKLVDRRIPVSQLFSPWLIPLLAAGALGLGLLAGLYPAFYLAGAAQPGTTVKPSGSGGRAGLRSALVVFQFTITLILLIGAFSVYRQLQYVRDKDLGFSREQVVTVRATPEIVRRYAALRDELRRVPGLSGTTLSGAIPGDRMIGEAFFPPEGGQTERVALGLIPADADFLDVMGIRLEQGRAFSADSPADDMIINLTAAERLRAAYGWENPLGRRLTTGRESGTVVGVIQDFHIASLHREISPIALLPIKEGEARFLSLRLESGDPAAALAGLRSQWSRSIPGQPFDGIFLDEKFAAMYGNETRTGNLLGIFALLAAFIACLGLLGLSAYYAEKRTKEIGIRKVLGASSGRITWMLLRRFALWALTAVPLALPPAYLLVRGWLRGFAYRISPSPALFLAAALLVPAAACLPVLVQALRSARTDPVTCLRYE